MEYELYHWGIKGMRWGIRRYQNKDGSLTPSGKKRYATAKEIEEREKNSERSVAARTYAQQMSEKHSVSELRKLADEENQKGNEYKSKAWQLEKNPSDDTDKWTEYQSKAEDHYSRENALRRLANDREATEKKKQDVMNSHDAKTVYRNKELLSDRELQEAYLRLNIERNIKNLIPEQKSKGQKFIDSFNDTGKNIKSVVDTADDLYKSYKKGKKLLETLLKTTGNKGG